MGEMTLIKELVKLWRKGLKTGDKKIDRGRCTAA
jgi:hypothetical protein